MAIPSYLGHENSQPLAHIPHGGIWWWVRTFPVHSYQELEDDHPAAIDLHPID